MELVKIAEQNKKYFSEDFIKGFNTGASRQYQHDTAEKTGRWIEQDDEYNDIIYQCSVCGEEFVTIEGTPADNLWNYCSNCGARMVE